jgi:hypothetical protein
MSTQEKITATNWAFTYVRRVISQRLGKFKSFALLNFNILCRPNWTGKEIISDDPAGLLRVLKYYSKMFALSFAIFLIANRFQLFEGTSEWRSLVTYVLQLIIAIGIIYVLCLVLPDRYHF